MTSDRPAIVITAKAPAPGRVKTRLAPALPADRAAALHTAFLSDTVRLARAVDRAEVIVMCPRGEGPALSRALAGAAGVEVVEQAGAGLEAAIDDVFVRFTAGGRRAVAIDSDTPHLAPAAIARALDALTRADLVVGPTIDGGFYLVGARQPHSGLFGALGTGDALAELAARARARRLTVWTGPEEFDVDRPDDLRRIDALLARDPSRAPATAALLRRWRLSPPVLP